MAKKYISEKPKERIPASDIKLMNVFRGFCIYITIVVRTIYHVNVVVYDFYLWKAYYILHIFNIKPLIKPSIKR